MVQDADGYWIVHYLGDVFHRAITQKQHRFLYEKAHAFVLQQLQQHRDSKNTKLALRYSHLLEYFDAHPTLTQSDDEAQPSIAVDSPKAAGGWAARLELMSLVAFFATLTPLRKAVLWSCTIWFLLFVYLGGPVGMARLIFQRTVFEIVLIQAINAIFSSFVIVELLRIVSKRAAHWTDRIHFSIVAAFWCLLTILTSAGVLLARSSGALT